MAESAERSANERNVDFLAVKLADGTSVRAAKDDTCTKRLVAEALRAPAIFHTTFALPSGAPQQQLSFTG